MGGIGRVFDGGYAEYTCVPARQVIPFESELLLVIVIGAIPEMLQTAHGSLTIGLDIQPGQSLLIRGGTSSASAWQPQYWPSAWAHRPGHQRATKPSGGSARRDRRRPCPDRATTAGLAAAVRRIVPDGVDAALELVGTPTLPDTLRATRIHGVVCFTGMLSNRVDHRRFLPH